MMKNPSLNYYPEVIEFAVKLLPSYHVNYFAMGRLYRDGRLYNVVSNPQWATDHLVHNKFPPAGLLNFDDIEGKKQMFSSENYDQMLGWSEGAYLAAKEKFNIKNILTIMVKSKDFMNQYMIDIHHVNAVDIYLNHPGYVEDFFNVLEDKFSDLINTIAKDPLVFDVQCIENNKLERNKSRGNNKGSLYHNGQLIKLSTQEYTCLERMAKGVRPKEIARNLQISSRTVETYINRIKIKLNTHSTSRLIKCYWDNVDFSRIY